MKIELDENWSILADTHSWRLEFSEHRVRDKQDKNHKKTGEKEEYTFLDAWYYPKVKMCLDTYLEESVKKDGTVQKMFETLERIESIIENLKNDTFIPCK